MNPEIQVYGPWKIAWVNSECVDQTIRLLEDGIIDGFGLSLYKGFRSSELGFVHGLDKLKGLVIDCLRREDLSELSALVNLQFLSLGDFKVYPDLSAFDHLESLACDWKKDAKMPHSNCPLRDLHLWKFSPKCKSVIPLSCYELLINLELVKSGVVSLEGIDRLGVLESAEFHYLAKLSSVAHLQGSPIEDLTFRNCPRIIDFESLAGCQKLKKLRCLDTALFKSLDFVRHCRMLRSLRFVGVDVLDGDLSPLLSLKDIAFDDRKHFSHKEKAIQDAIGMPPVENLVPEFYTSIENGVSRQLPFPK